MNVDNWCVTDGIILNSINCKLWLRRKLFTLPNHATVIRGGLSKVLLCSILPALFIKMCRADSFAKKSFENF